jgi:hypothetical protein
MKRQTSSSIEVRAQRRKARGRFLAVNVPVKTRTKFQALLG